MFTGIVTAVGTVTAARQSEDGLQLAISSAYDGIEAGESIAVDGACLTVETVSAPEFTVHVIRTSLDRTRFAEFRRGQRVNLERALRIQDRLGGHIVQGHVDGVGRVVSIVERDDARILDIEVPPEIRAIAIPLGSIAVDGVSLTVNALPAPDIIQVSLIPFTLQHTTLGNRLVGDRVHLEGDLVGKYIAALVEPWKRPPSP